MVMRNERKFESEKRTDKDHLGDLSINKRVDPKEMAFHGNDRAKTSNSIFMST
jgi:hypothetical protein